MAYIGIGYSGPDSGCLKRFFEKEQQWIDAERKPIFFGDAFVVLFDSNTSREIVKKINTEKTSSDISVFSITGEI